MSANIRLMIVDDQQLLRRGLVMLFGTVEDIDVAAQAAHGVEALAVLRTTPVDVVLADVKMPTMGGIELVRRCSEDYPGLPVLVLTTFDEPEIVQGAIEAGAAGFLLKDASIESLAEAVRAVAVGGLVIDPRVARLAVSAQQKKDQGKAEASVLAVLTPTERQVASLVAEGMSNQAIAEAMVLAEGTVKNHVSALLRKLEAPDRTVLALTLYKALCAKSRD